MYLVIIGGGKVGANVGRALLRLGHEISLIEVSRPRFVRLEGEFEHMVRYGDGTEIHVLSEAGLGRADACIAVTGDDEDNIIICQVAREMFNVQSVVARVNDPRNQQHFDLLEITPTVCSTTSILSLIEHEVPQHGVIPLLSLRQENLDIIELQLNDDSPVVGMTLGEVVLPGGGVVVSVLRDRKALLAKPALQLAAADQLIAIVEPAHEAAVATLILGSEAVRGAL